MGFAVLPDPDKLKGLTSLSRAISELANLERDERLPFVGANSFTHKGGTHVNALLKNPRTFEHIFPEAVGNRRRYVLSELSGRSNVLEKAKELGLQLSAQEVQRVLEELKRLEHEGYQFEDADASFELLVRRACGEVPEFFELVDYHVHGHRDRAGADQAIAVVKVRVKGQEVLEGAEGDGPVSALDNALRRGLCRFYPEIGRMRLVDYKVRILESERGTAAKPRVILTTSDGRATWSTVGVSYDILEASWIALSDGYIYGLLSSLGFSQKRGCGGCRSRSRDSGG